MNLVKQTRSTYTLYLPEKLNPETLDELQQIWSRIDFEAVRFLILRGNAEAFCLGMDLNWVAQEFGDDFQAEVEPFISFLKSLQSASVITIAVIEGAAVGGGVGIAAACDCVLASTQSTFRLTEGMLGLIPGIILSPLLSRLSVQQIKQMVFAAQEYGAADALHLGLVDRICKSEDLGNSLQAITRLLKHCKKQSVQDLKSILSEAPRMEPNRLYESGASLLGKRLAQPATRERLENLIGFYK